MSKNNVVIGEVRYSRDMRLFRAVTLGLGVSLSVGVFLLLGPIAHWEGARGTLDFLVAGALFLPMTLSLAELASAGGPGGIYQLIRASERQLVSYFAGWAMLGGELYWPACWLKAAPII